MCGLSFNGLALVVFIRLGRSKPYYVIAIFETITDLVTSTVAVYSGTFLVLGIEEKPLLLKLALKLVTTVV